MSNPTTQRATHQAAAARTQRHGTTQANHAYGKQVYYCNEAIRSLRRISGRKVPFLAGQKLDVALASLREAIQIFDEFKQDEY